MGDDGGARIVHPSPVTRSVVILARRMPADDGAADASAFADWLARARAGDAAAVERVLERTATRLRGFVEARLGERLRASLRHSDVLQNTYLQMLDAFPSFDGSDEDQFVAWVTKIIEHDIHRQHRWFGAKKRRPPS